MKKAFLRYLWLLCLPALLCAGMTGCGGQEKEDGAGISVVTTVFPLYDFAKSLLGDAGTVTLLLKPGSESHSYEPTPKDILAIQNCDLFACIGGESESWVKDLLLASAKNPDRQTVTMMDCVEVLPEERAEGMEADEEEEEEGETEYDEHIWTSPKNAVLMVEKLKEALIRVAPDAADTVRQNAADYTAKLNALDGAFAAVAADAVRSTVAVGDRFPFLYLFRAYGFSYIAAFPGCSRESEASAATVAFLIEKVKSEKLPYVFSIEMSKGQVADTVAAAAGAGRLTLHSCNNVTADEWAAGETYLSLMEKNAAALRMALCE